jgi:rhomboid family GlyGly-CTERM serine protease
VSAALLRRPGVAWCAAALLMFVGTLAAWSMPHSALDWQPARAPQAWRWWSAAFVHYSGQHMTANLGAVMLVAAYGWIARVPLRSTLAWCAAWPLTHLLLLVQPALPNYGGLSGLMHTGVAVVCVHLVFSGTHAQKFVAAAVFTGMAAKIVSESPFGEPLRHVAEWDIAVAPLGHLTGAVAGTLCSAAAELRARRAAQARMRLTSDVVE